MQEVRAHFYASFHSGRAMSNNPVSRASLRELTGVPERTQLAYEKAVKLQPRRNLAVGERSSKAALEIMVKTWAAELERTKVRVNLLSPGIVRTAMRAAAFPGEDPARLRPPQSITDAFVDLAAPDCTRSGEIVTGY